MHSDQSFGYKIFYFLPIIAVLLFKGSIIYYWINITILPFALKFFSLKNISIFITSIAILCTLINYFLCIITNPGSVPENYSFNQGLKDNLTHNYFCDKCMKQRPERSHHCSSCKRCILKMDHHCPWIGNCVGLYNQKIFLLFLFYSALSTLFVFLDFLPFFLLLSNIEKVKDENYIRTYDESIAFNHAGTISLITVVTPVLFMALLAFFLFNIYLVIINKTSVEHNCGLFSNMQSPYFLRSKLLSMKIIFGNTISKWFIPIVELNEYNNEIYFKKEYQDVSLTV